VRRSSVSAPVGRTAQVSREHTSISLLRAVLATIVVAFALQAWPNAAPEADAADPQTVVSLTFNDANVSAYTYARPILQAHAMNATFYVASGWIDKSLACCMPWWQVDDLYRDGNEIGGMGTDHKDLTQTYFTDWTQDYAYKQQQVCGDRQRLSGRGYDPQSFAYPAGAYRYTYPDASTAQSIVKGCGYRSARAVGGLSPTGPVYSEPLPPKDALAVRTPNNSSTAPLQLSTLQSWVTGAATHGGGWVPLVFNQVCHNGASTYSSCMSSSKPIDDSVFSAFLDWLANAGQPGGSPAGTIVQTVRQAVGAPPQPTLPPRPTVVSLTFDDGDASQSETLPMLTAHDMRGTFYISSSNKTITWPQVSDLYAAGNEIGGHTAHHVDLTSSSLTNDQKVREVCDDRQTLIQRGYNPVSFAYPFGSYDQNAQNIVQSCGYQSGRRAGGVTQTGPTYSETIPPANAYTIRTAYRAATDELQLADLTAPVTAAASHGGGWVVLVFHEICVQGQSDFNSCMASYKPVRNTTFNAFLDWLRDSAPPDTSVRTVGQVMNVA
jgi:peptidoglycan/xylan/chitin deacetylase (PgdA/CDA1 family)